MKLLIIAIFLAAARGEMNGPKNTLSVVGSSVTMKCATASRNCSGFRWTKSIPDVSLTNIFMDGEGILSPFRDRYSVNNSSGCDLVIRNVQLTDAGRFICNANVSSAPNTHTIHEKSAYLNVLQAQPQCSTTATEYETVEGDWVHLTCEVTYNTTTAASIMWRGAGDVQAVADHGRTLSRSYFYLVASAHEVPAYSCLVLFAVDTQHSGIARNIPVATCATLAIRFFYSVREVTWSPSSAYISPGSSITAFCYARGHPPPTFKWQELYNGGWVDVQYGSRLLVNDAPTSLIRFKWYRCVAMNVVKGRSYNTTSPILEMNRGFINQLEIK